MARPIGHPKSGGRIKGTPNKRSLDLVKRFDEAGLDPVAELLSLYRGMDVAKRADTLLALMPYFFPKKKPVESPVDEETYELEFVDE